MEKVVVSNKLIGKGTNTSLREEALKRSNYNRALNYIKEIEVVTEEEIVPSIPDFLLRIQDERRKARRNR